MGLFKKLFDYVSPSKRKAAKNLADRLKRVQHQPQPNPREQAELARKLKGVKGVRVGRVAGAAEVRDEARQARQASERVVNNPIGRYLYLGEPVTNFTSSNVRLFWYEINAQILHIQFKMKDGEPAGTYGYGVAAHNITPEMAMSLFRSGSKGTWVWDRLRLRGTPLGHKVDYELELSGSTPYKWERSAESAEAHAQTVAAQSVYDQVGRFERNQVIDRNMQSVARRQKENGEWTGVTAEETRNAGEVEGLTPRVDENGTRRYPRGYLSSGKVPLP